MSSDPIPSEPPNPPPIFPDDDLEDDVVSSDDPSSDSNDVVPDPDSSDDQDDTVSPPTTTLTTTNIPPPITVIPTPPPPSTTTAITAVIATAAPPERKPIDDSRRLFQRLWTDEDEIELLQGFLDYTSSRGGATASGHHHDTAAFYDQIKNKLQLEFNKNQLVEKLRRLKKKYRNVLSKMTSGKDFVFKSPHDHATFEISRKIWSNLSANYRAGGGAIGGAGGGAGALAVVEYDDEDHNPNRNAVYNPVTIAAATPPRPVNSSYVISHINLNAASPGGGSGSGSGGGYDMNSSAGLSKLSTRKRPRVTGGKVEEKMIKTEGGIVNNNVVNSSGNNNNNNHVGPNNYVNNVAVSPPLQGLVEETVRNCLSPVLKNLINNATNSAIVASPNNVGSRGFKGVGTLALNAVPLNFAGVTNVEGGMDEKWRKQQILELEVYSKRLELVQDQIKLSLEELRSMES